MTRLRKSHERKTTASQAGPQLTLQSLPTDIQQHLPRFLGLNDIAQLSQTCRNFRGETNSYLFPASFDIAANRVFARFKLKRETQTFLRSLVETIVPLATLTGSPNNRHKFKIKLLYLFAQETINQQYKPRDMIDGTYLEPNYIDSQQCLTRPADFIRRLFYSDARVPRVLTACFDNSWVEKLRQGIVPNNSESNVAYSYPKHYIELILWTPELAANFLQRLSHVKIAALELAPMLNYAVQQIGADALYSHTSNLQVQHLQLSLTKLQVNFFELQHLISWTQLLSLEIKLQYCRDEELIPINCDKFERVFSTLQTPVPQLQTIILKSVDFEHPILGPQGMTAFASACERNIFPGLVHLSLECQEADLASCEHFVNVLSQGSLPNLKHLLLAGLMYSSELINFLVATITRENNQIETFSIFALFRGVAEEEHVIDIIPIIESLRNEHCQIRDLGLEGNIEISTQEGSLGNLDATVAALQTSLQDPNCKLERLRIDISTHFDRDVSGECYQKLLNVFQSLPASLTLRTLIIDPQNDLDDIPDAQQELVTQAFIQLIQTTHTLHTIDFAVPEEHAFIRPIVSAIKNRESSGLPPLNLPSQQNSDFFLSCYYHNTAEHPSVSTTP